MPIARHDTARADDLTRRSTLANTRAASTYTAAGPPLRRRHHSHTGKLKDLTFRHRRRGVYKQRFRVKVTRSAFMRTYPHNSLRDKRIANSGSVHSQSNRHMTNVIFHIVRDDKATAISQPNS